MNIEKIRNQFDEIAEYVRMETELRIKYEEAISRIANIDASFLNGEGNMENYSPEEELRRIHQIVTPLWEEIVESHRKKEEAIQMEQMKVKVFNDDEEVFEGTLDQFLKDNDYDEWLVNLCRDLNHQDKIDFNEHSGHWVIQKIQ